MTDTKAVAIIGLSCSYPGSPGPEQFWRTSYEGRSFFRDVPLDRWDHGSFYSPNPRHTDSTYARKIAYLDDIRSFSPERYGMPPRRARPMDPQQRLILDQTRLAIHDAGYDERPLPRSTGVYIGASVTEYKDLVVSRLRAQQILRGEWGDVPTLAAESIKASVQDIAPIQQYSMVGLLLNMIACNVSEAFSLEGPSLVLDAACSSALLAVHEAVLHLRTGISDAAVVGGVYTICTPDLLVGFSRIGAVSRSDVCRPFDEKADGFVLGEGVGVVVLKRLEDALRDNDRVLAVIRGIGLNNDGRSEGPMTPRMQGQAEALRRAYCDAGVSPDTIGYIEAHGTATPVGDRTEMGALMANAQSNGNGKLRCAVASVKGNVGHTLAAAGMAGLIRSVMVLNHKVIPPQAGLQTTRADLGLDGSGFYVPTAAQAFEPQRGLPRRVGVNAFGFGGTNVHVILEEPSQELIRPMFSSNGSEDRFSSRPFWVIEHKEKSNGFGGPPTASLEVNSAQPTPNGELKALFEKQITALKMQMDLIESQAKLLNLSNGHVASTEPSAKSFTAEVNGNKGPATSGPTIESTPSPVETPLTPSPDSIRQSVIELIARVSAFAIDDLKPEKRLGADLGFDSLVGADLFVALTEAFPQTRTMPESLLGGDTTIEQLVQAVVAAITNNGAETSGRETTVGEIRRYVVVPKDRPSPQSEKTKLPFESAVLLVPDSSGVAELLALRLRDAHCEVKIVSPQKPLAIDHESALIDLTGLDTQNSSPTSDFKSPIMTTLARAAEIASKSPLGGFVVVHRGLTGAGLAGIAKSVAREYPQSLVRSIEIEDDLSPEALAENIFTELTSGDRTVEVRYAGGRRQTLGLEQRPIEPGSLREGVVVAIAGGGRGLGAKLGIELARRHKARLLLLGRAAESDATVQSVRAAGGEALYISCDVRDREQVESAFQMGRTQFGPIECVVHAAGVLADQSLASKNVEQAAPVVDTKIAGALALWEAARPDPLISFVMYGSWAGRFGSPHQSDYSAANNVLGRLASHLGDDRPSTRVVTIDLPPWEDSGMVSRLTENARRALQSRVTFLTDSTGLDHVIAEMGAQGPSQEIVLGAGLDDEQQVDEIAIQISTAQYPWLDDHRINGQVIVPFALALDHCAAAARRLGLGPALTFSDVEILEPLIVENSGSSFAITARAHSSGADMSIERTSNGANRRLLRLSASNGASISPLQLPNGGQAPELPLSEFYQQHTFHGPRLRALTSVLETGRTYAIGLARTAESDGLKGAVADVLSLDAMLQLCAYWATIHLGQIGLPTGADQVTILGRAEPGATVRIAGQLKDSTDGVFAADLDLLNSTGEPLVQIRGLRCRLLPRDFASKKQPTADEKIDQSNWRIDEFPEVKALEQRFELARATGIESPYFSVHERVTNDTSVIGGREYINFASYNYLGLSGDAEVTAGALEAMQRYGTSVSASRLASGEKPLHHELEREIADFLGCEDAIVMVSGHATNVSVIGHVFGPQDLIVHDSLAHDSIVAGVRLSGAKRRAFPHNDVDALDQILRQTRQQFRRVLIAVEGVYSMDGDIAPLDRIIEVKKRHHALLLVDEAHSLGVLGQTGRGIGEHFNINPQDVEMWMGTLSKSLASCGGYIAGSAKLVQYLKYSNPGFVYSVGISPANAGAALAALQKMRAHPDLVTTLRERSRMFLDLSRARGINTGFSEGTAVVPCIVGNSWHCLRLSHALAERAINVQPILYPAVEEQQTRLRFFLTARHSEAQIQSTVTALAEELEKIDPRLLNPRLSQ
jgi:8-amino-7-oxononanoate synthase